MNTSIEFEGATNASRSPVSAARRSLALSLALATMVTVGPAMADPAGAASTPSTNTTSEPLVASDLPNAASAPPAASDLPNAAPTSSAVAPTTHESPSRVFLPPVQPLQAAPVGASLSRPVTLSPTGLSYSVVPKPEPRRSPGKIVGGVALVGGGTAAVIISPPMFVVGAVAALFHGGIGSAIMLSSVGTFAAGACGLAFGVPLIRNGARKIVRDPPPSAMLQISPGALTLTF
ncbi:MAG: hypothetical protein IPK82_35040 [Polyangiaceae bacterium]|nr:hypothetical protein [Polyangiaceae bacterium]